MRASIAYGWLQEHLIYATVSGSRFTQRSPVMGDVWIQYGVVGAGPHDLLLIANWGGSSASLAASLRRRLGGRLSAEDAASARADARIAATPSVVAAWLSFAQLMRAALPLSPFWHRYLIIEGDPAAYFESDDAFTPLRAALRAGLANQGDAADSQHAPPHVTGDLLWLTRTAGFLALLHERLGGQGLASVDEKELDAWEKVLDDHDALIDAFFRLLRGISPPAPEEPLWSVHRNREVQASIRESTATVKADAARQVFDVTGRGIRWAVIDTGIDAEHVAFRKRDPKNGKIYDPPFAPPDKDKPGGKSRAWTNQTRIAATYDFRHVRELMGASPQHLDSLPAEMKDLKEQLKDDTFKASLTNAIKAMQQLDPDADEEDGSARPKLHNVDWELWEPVLRVPHTDRYRKPPHKHGTHVAGIIGADWRPEDLKDDIVRDEKGTPRRRLARKGMCPEIELYDLRVLDQDGKANEFAVLAALQYVRALNARFEHVEIHGVNLSLSLVHDVSNYACGRTPVCEECERLVASGVNVVASAGNQGRARYTTTNGEIDEGYRTVSITDPGNAPSVITVGATHRSEPHTYGVSYFSSRGPTGDGRRKPDIVAPGEKVTSTVPGNKEEPLDGTSMAAPHVSGAAALLLCRYAELIGNPAEVKRILCKTATDLGRDPYFQGAGLLDVLRALESV